MVKEKTKYDNEEVKYDQEEPVDETDE